MPPLPFWMEQTLPKSRIDQYRRQSIPEETRESPPEIWFEENDTPDIPEWMNELPPMPTEAGDMLPILEWMEERDEWFDV